jgi:hypothetical protein
MSNISKDFEQFPVMARPFSAARSKLGTVTKLYGSKFLCNEMGIHELYNLVLEKLGTINPESGGFQFLVSFDDRTNYEHHDINELDHVVKNNGKTTERLTLKWVAIHKIEEEEHELTIVLRISNPVNPFLFLQAALSKSPNDIDNLEFENGSVSVSVDGASQIMAEEIFSIIGRWVDSRPQPQYVTSLHDIISKHQEKIAFLNHWLLPLLIAGIFFLLLWKHTPSEMLIPVLFVAVISNYYLRHIGSMLNGKIQRWCHFSMLFSIFSLTGGDNNQQAKFASRSSNSLIKLLVVTALTFVLNVVAGITVTWLFRL